MALVGRNPRFPGSNTTGLEFNIRPKLGSSMFINVDRVFFWLILGGIEIGREIDLDVGVLAAREYERGDDRANQNGGYEGE